MIVFNGTALESVAPVMIEDIRISPISLGVTARERPVRFGADFVRMTGGSRTVAITFSVLTENREARTRQLQAITDWARTEAEGILKLPDLPERYLNCICTGLPEPSARQWWESKLRLVFSTVSDPYWNDIEEKHEACGTAFTVLGSAPPRMQIRYTNPSSGGLIYSDGTDTITLGSVGAGNLMIDLNHQTIQLGSSSIMNQYSFGSSFIQPRTGNITITGSGNVYWRERWQ